MNFSFSEVKTSLDKSMFDKQMILHTEAALGPKYNMLESIQQEDDEDNDTIFKQGSMINSDKVQYES